MPEVVVAPGLAACSAPVVHSVLVDEYGDGSYAFRERHPCVVEDDVLRECYAATASSVAPCGSTAKSVAEFRQL